MDAMTHQVSQHVYLTYILSEETTKDVLDTSQVVDQEGDGRLHESSHASWRA